jgi:predicted nuclease of predicted toxin-antitoxin system
MRFKLDENLSQSVAALFRAAGHDALTVRDQGLRGAPDEEIFNLSAREDRFLVTLDKSSAFRPRQAPGSLSSKSARERVTEVRSNGRGSS